MAHFRVRLVLNPGGDGVRLDKLANISGELEKFLRSLAEDCGVSTNPSEWIARNFKDGSLGADIEHVGIVEPPAAVKFNAGVRKFTAFRQDHDRLNGEYSETTVRAFVNIGKKLDPDEVVRIGIVEPDAATTESAPQEWTQIAKRTTVEVEDAVLREVEYHGSIQGRLSTWHRDAEPPFVSVRDGATGALVHCNYKPDSYDTIYRAHKDRLAIVHINGRIKSDRLTGHPREVWIEDIKIFDRLTDAEFFALSGSAPDLTGKLTAAEVIDRMRDDDE